MKEWDADFKAMKQMGINTVVLIRAGLGSWIAAPFDCLLRTGKVKYPPVDLVEMFLALSDKYGMDFWFGTYDSCYHWHVGEYEKEIELNMQLIDEVWAKYGHHNRSGAGISRRRSAAAPATYRRYTPQWAGTPRRYRAG